MGQPRHGVRVDRHPSRARPEIAIVLLLCGLSGCSGCESPPVPEPPASAAAGEPSPAAEAPAEEPASAAAPTEPTAMPQPAELLASAEAAADGTNSAGAGPKSAKSSPAVPSGASASTTVPSNPQDALAEAQRRYESARQHRTAGRPGAAFQEAAHAWQIANAFPGDPGCRKLAATIFAELDGYARAANRSATGGTGTVAPDKTLIDR